MKRSVAKDLTVEEFEAWAAASGTGPQVAAAHELCAPQIGKTAVAVLDCVHRTPFSRKPLCG